MYLCHMKKWRYISLTESDYYLVELGYQEGEKHHYRERCHAILLSHQHYKIMDIARMFNKKEDTIRTWFNQWELHGLKGLEIQPGRGLKPKLVTENVELVDFVKKSQRTAAKIIKYFNGC